MIRWGKQTLILGMFIGQLCSLAISAQPKPKLQLSRVCTSNEGTRYEMYNATGIYTEAATELRTYSVGKAIPQIISSDDSQFAGRISALLTQTAGGKLKCTGTVVFNGSEMDAVKEDLYNYRHSGCQHRKYIESAKKTVNKWALTGSARKTAQEINLDSASAGARTAIESFSMMNSLNPHRCRDLVDGLIRELNALPTTKTTNKMAPHVRSKAVIGNVS